MLTSNPSKRDTPTIIEALKSTISLIEMKNEKTREEIVAEREAKKKAKLIAKKKLNTSTSSSTNDTKLQRTLNLDSPSIAKDTQSEQVLSEKKSKPSSANTIKPKHNERSIANKSETSIDAQSSKAGSPKVAISKAKHPPTQKTRLISDPKTSVPVTQTSQQVGKATSNHQVGLKESECTVDKGKLKEKVVKDAELMGESLDKGVSKAELKAARRLKQEMQRAAKASQQNVKVQKPAIETQSSSESQLPAKPSQKKIVKIARPKDGGFVKTALKPKAAEHKVKLFNHLYCDEEPSICNSLCGLHPALISLGLQYANRVIVGSNARCFSFMNALRKVIEDYTTPQQKEFARGLESSLQPCLAFLQRCRPLAVSMTNAMKHLKWQMTQLPNDVTDVEAKKKLQEAIDTYLRDQIDVAAQAICITVRKKISDGDVILTYGCSSLVQRILIEAHDKGTKFRVVIVDARPLCEGLQLLHRLGKHGIRCSYVLIGGASCMMREATKVLLGAHALLANGYVMSRAGASQIALLAHSYNVPVLVCCETYKFCERVQTDALVHNEIGDPDALISCRSSEDDRPLTNWRSIANLTPLNLTYDVTPPDLVTAVVTELAILPCTSVPVILRIKPTDSHH